MGYTTDFQGSFQLDKPLTPEQVNYLRRFSRTRRMARNAEMAKKLNDPLRIEVGLPIGRDAEFFVGDETAERSNGQERDASIKSYNEPPATQPGLWCQWIPTDDGTAIEWDGGEKFYHYQEWLKYIIRNFLEPWGYKLTGDVTWQGEDSSDMGMLSVADNILKVKHAKITYEE